MDRRIILENAFGGTSFLSSRLPVDSDDDWSRYPIILESPGNWNMIDPEIAVQPA
jgi:hypothetical protein